MLNNFHTHTVRCHHAQGTEREYIEQAIAAGMTELGFSDHSPYYYPGDYKGFTRMSMDQLGDYVETLLALKEEYADRITIHIGMETEYYPANFDRVLKEYEKYPIEYMILGQHFLGNEVTREGTYGETDDEDRLRRYVSQSIEGMETGAYTYFAHPDFLCFTGDEGVRDRYLTELCRAARRCGLPLEINLLGIRGKRSYPTYHFFELAAAEGNEIVIGSDAHAPGDVADTASCAVAMEWVRKLDLKLVERPELVLPRRR